MAWAVFSASQPWEPLICSQVLWVTQLMVASAASPQAALVLRRASLSAIVQS